MVATGAIPRRRVLAALVTGVFANAACTPALAPRAALAESGRYSRHEGHGHRTWTLAFRPSDVSAHKRGRARPKRRRKVPRQGLQASGYAAVLPGSRLLRCLCFVNMYICILFHTYCCCSSDALLRIYIYTLVQVVNVCSWALPLRGQCKDLSSP